MNYLLAAAGHQVRTSTDGLAAIELAERECPDLVVCDIEMPVLSGYEVARRFKASPTLNSVPLVAVTANGEEKDRISLEGFTGFLPKPIQPRTFVSQVMAFLPSRVNDPKVHVAGEANPGVTAKTILMVDDSPIDIELTQRILEPYGFRVTGVCSSAAALQTVGEGPQDVILESFRLAQASNYFLIQTMKADKLLNGIPHILIAASSLDESDLEQARCLGATKILIRPISPQQLAKEISEV